MPDPDGPALTDVFTSDSLRGVCHNAGADDLIVFLDHLQRRDGRFVEPSFPTRLRNRAFLQIQCLTNSWFLSPDTQGLRAALMGFCARFSTVTVLGSSMGGYGALLLGRELHATQMLLVSPQASIFPARAPFEQRFTDYAAPLDPGLDQALESDPDYCRGVLIYDPAVPQDRQHKTLICQRFPGLQSLAFAFAGHPALGLVSKEQRFGEVLDELLSPPLDPQRLRQLHRSLRGRSPDYQARLATYLNNRRMRGRAVSRTGNPAR